MPSNTTPIKFSKLNACGNDFICINDTESRLAPDGSDAELGKISRRLCRRGLSVGADGVILATRIGNNSGGIDAVARFLEPDGSEADLCGNGTACFVLWTLDEGIAQGPEVRILTRAGTAIGTRIDGNPGSTRVCVPNPKDLNMDIEVEVHGNLTKLHYIHTGVPHVINFVENLENIDVASKGACIRNHPNFQPAGANANFVTVIEEGHIRVRTYEFGVEAETLACGTGSVSAALISCIRHGWSEAYRTGEKPVKVEVRGGGPLQIWFKQQKNGTFKDVCLDTTVSHIFDGTLSESFMAQLGKSQST